MGSMVAAGGHGTRDFRVNRASQSPQERGTDVRKAPFEWRRGPRSSFSLGAEAGVYALFLRAGAALPVIEPSGYGPIYVGLAASRAGLRGRCHFDARTRNHSPRKSLAVLLMDELSLIPVLITKPNSSNTWGLDRPSDARLSAWMHANLELAIEVCPDPGARETELIGRYAPPLNFTKCVQTEQHRRISDARTCVLAELQGCRGLTVGDNPGPERMRAKATSVLADDGARPIPKPPNSARQFFGADIDTAEAIAARYSLSPKSYRQRLRDSIPWYRKPQDWTFPEDSSAWRDMIAVAERMVR